MNSSAAYWAKNRRHGAAQCDKIAELVAEGYSVAAAGRAIGITQQRASKFWLRIRADLGPQAV